MKSIILCADDFGYNSAINSAILTLLKNKRLSATSCLTNFANFSQDANQLSKYKNIADIGLHFNLTEGQALTKVSSITDKNGQFLSLSKVMLSAFTGKIKLEDVYQELSQQYDHFKQILGITPSHIDGHQHIQHLPIIRTALLQFIRDNNLSPHIYLRNAIQKAPFFPFNNWIKTNIITYTGAKRFKSKLNTYKIAHNTTFGGIYCFNDKQSYRNIFLKTLKHIENKGIIMCHPAIAASRDPISRSRYNEYIYLDSDTFLNDCKHFNIKVEQFNP